MYTKHEAIGVSAHKDMEPDEKPWARMRIHGPCMIFSWHDTEGEARTAIEASRAKGNFAPQAVSYFPDRDSAPRSRKIVVFGRSCEITADLIEEVMRQQSKPLRIGEIIPLLKSKGWNGSGDWLKDYKNLHTNITNKPKRFRSVSRGHFGLCPALQTGEPK